MLPRIAQTVRGKPGASPLKKGGYPGKRNRDICGGNRKTLSHLELLDKMVEPNQLLPRCLKNAQAGETGSRKMSAEETQKRRFRPVHGAAGRSCDLRAGPRSLRSHLPRLWRRMYPSRRQSVRMEVYERTQALAGSGPRGPRRIVPICFSPDSRAAGPIARSSQGIRARANPRSWTCTMKAKPKSNSLPN